MEIEEGPWLSPRDSQEWLDYKETLIDLWTPAYLLASIYAVNHHFELTNMISETIIKASFNFPSPFFQPLTTPFHYEKYNYNARSFCRLIRKAGYLEEYHTLFDNGSVDEHILGQWTFDILQRIGALTKNPNHREISSMLLLDDAFNRNRLFYSKS